MAIDTKIFDVFLDWNLKIMTLSPKFIADIQSLIQEQRLKKGAILLNSRETPLKYWWIFKGCAREFRLDYNQLITDQTQWFWYDGDFIYTMPGFFSQRASDSYIELLEDSHLLYIEFQTYKLLKARYEEAEQYWELIREQFKVSVFQHLTEMRSLSAKERYLSLFKAHPKIFYLAKQKDIAYFLGIKADTLSRLRRS